VIEDVIVVGVPAIIALSIVRIVLMMQPAPGNKLPPAGNIGLPSGRLLPPSAVHVAAGGGKRRWWK
jgi:hypothetical protein